MHELQIVSDEYGECSEKSHALKSQIKQKLTAKLTKYLLHRKNCKRDGSREKTPLTPFTTLSWSFLLKPKISRNSFVVLQSHKQQKKRQTKKLLFLLKNEILFLD